VIRLVVDDALGERLPHDPTDALGRKLLLAGDFVIGPALAHAGQNAPAPQDSAARVKPAMIFRLQVMQNTRSIR